MKFSKLFLIAFSASLFVSCSNDEESSDPKGIYDNGVFILNEGSSDHGTVSFLTDDLAAFTKDIYGSANNKDNPGGYLQNIFFDGDNAYIISGGSDVINVVNRYTFKLVGKIETGLENPRYGVVKDGKAYVTNANTYGSTKNPAGYTDDYIAIIDLKTNKYESKIDLNATGNRLVLENGKLYITEPYDSTKLLVVNIATKTLETPIEIGSNADCIEEQNGSLYILRAPYTDRSEIVKVKLSDKSISKITFPETLDGAGFMDIEDDKIYYTVGSSVYAINANATAASTTSIVTSPASYVYGFAVNDNRIYISHGDFTKDGSAYIYDLSGNLLKELTTGIGTNGFYFND
ncbi:YncE family protein [Flavobacterium hibisci]|uniref:YncE family protein n=1 Tax=Flavobacterium hibisci TaxID=1914462 RepID=UPI001CBEACF1|nr:glutaminyl-peptide cyclotransferase [Flavobacterium hibisci]MBZ4043199.1 glutaminyl-peptide cyclotransferase [Flavobacterium hibisci]